MRLGAAVGRAVAGEDDRHVQGFGTTRQAVSPLAALRRLAEGNARYASGTRSVSALASPLMSAKKLAGLVTLSDLLMAEAISNIDPTRVQVDVVMARDVYAAPPSAPIDEVVQVMAREEYGSTVVSDGDKVVGVFTVVDVCHALADLLRQD